MISGCEVYLTAFGSFRCYWFMSLFNNFLPWFLKCSGKPQSKNHVILTTQSYDRSKYNYPVQLCNPFKDHVLHRWLHNHKTPGLKLKPSKKSMGECVLCHLITEIKEKRNLQAEGWMLEYQLRQTVNQIVTAPLPNVKTDATMQLVKINSFLHYNI